MQTIRDSVVVLLFLILLGQTVLAQAQSKAKMDESVTLRFLLPVQDAAKKSSAPKWGLAAPVVNDFSDPNEIVYDEDYMKMYVNWACNSPIVCGGATYSITTPNGVVSVTEGLGCSYLGQKFRAEDLMRFLKTRIEGKKEERTLRIDDSDVVKRFNQSPESMTVHRLSCSPWDWDTYSVVRLLWMAKHIPAYPLFKSLVKDPSPLIRSLAVSSMGSMADLVPQAGKDVAPFLADKELCEYAMTGLSYGGHAGVRALVEAMDHADGTVRNRAVFALARMDLKYAAAGLVAALDHPKTEIRVFAMTVVQDRQSRGAALANDDIVDALGRRLADGDDELRLRAVRVLCSLKSAAVRAKPILLKMAAEDRGEIGKLAREALKSIEDKP